MANDVVRDVTIRLRIDNKALNAPAVNVAPVEQATKRIEQSYKAAFRNIAKQHDEMIAQQRKGMDQLAEQRKSGPTMGAQLGQAAQGLKQAGEGVFTLARGLALVTSDNEEDIAVLTRRIAKYQGMFDIFKGGTDVVAGLANVTKLFTLTQVADTGATAARTVATTGLAAAQGAAASAGASLLAIATGPIGIGIGVVTAATLVGAAAWYKYGAASDSVSESMKRKVEQLREVALAERRLIEVQQQSQRNSAQETTMAASRDFDLSSTSMTTSGRLSRIEEDRKKARQASILGTLRAADTGKDQFLGQSAGVDFKGLKPTADQYSGLTDNLTNYLKVLRNVGNAEEALKQARSVGSKDGSVFAKGDVDAQKAELARISEGETNLLNQRLEKQKLVKGLLEGELSTRQQSLALLSQEQQRMESLVTAERQRLEAIEKSIKAEEQKGLSQIEKFGRMSEFDQQYLIQLGERVKTDGIDSLSQFDRDKLDQSGFAQGLIQRNYIDKGKKALEGSNLFENLGTNNVTAIEAAGGDGIEGTDRTERLKMQQQQAAGNVKEAQGRSDQYLKKIAEERAKMAELLKELGDNSGVIQAIENAITMRDQKTREMEARLSKLDTRTAKTETDVARRNTMLRPGAGG